MQLHNSFGPLSVPTWNSQPSLDAAGADISITNVSSSNVVSYDFGFIMALKGEENNSNRQWVISPVRIIISILSTIFF